MLTILSSFVAEYKGVKGHLEFKGNSWILSPYNRILGTCRIDASSADLNIISENAPWLWEEKRILCK